MSESRKERIITDLQQAKQTGELKTERIREIVRNAIAMAVSEVKEGRTEITSLVQDAIAAVTETFKEKSGEIKEEVAASIEGAIDGISEARRQKIAETKSEINTLEAKVVVEEEELQQDIDQALTEVKTQSNAEPDKVKQAIIEAIAVIGSSEEFAVLQKRYAQLKAQTAVLQANLANRYGGQYETVNKHLDEAKAWYEKAKEEPEVFTEKITQKRTEVEQKLGEAGSAAARKEKQVKQLLRELWKSIGEAFRDKSAK